jgi:hypothetical protein
MATRDIRTTFVLDGEAKYSKAMKSISTEMRLLDAELGKATVGFDKNADAMAILSATSSTLQKKMDVQKQKIEAVAKELADAEKAYGENSDQAKKYAIELANAETKLGKLANELKDNDRQMESLKASTDDAAKEMGQFDDKISQASSQASTSTGSFDKLGSALKSGIKVGAMAAAGAIAAVTTAAISATKAVVDLSDESANWADELLTTSTQMGISAETLQEWSYAARFIDTETESMQKGMYRVVKAMDEATRAGLDNIEITDSLSVSMKNTNGTYKDSEEVFYSTIDALGQIADETEREIAAQEIFGKSYQDMVPLINAGSEGLRAYAKEAHESGVILSDDVVGALGDYDDVLQRVDAQQDALKKSFVVNFIPALTSGADALTGIMDTASTALEDGFQPSDVATIGASVSEAILGILSNISSILPDVVGVLTELLVSVVKIVSDVLPVLLPIIIDSAFLLLQALMDAIISNTQPIADMITQLVLGMVNFIVENLPLVIESALSIVMAVSQGIIEALPELLPAIDTMVLGMVNFIVENLPLVIESALSIVMAVAQGIIEALPELLPAIDTMMKKVVEIVLTMLPQIITLGLQLITSLAEGLTQSPEAIDATIDMIGRVIQTILDNLPMIIAAGNDLLVAIAMGVIEYIPVFLENFPVLIQKIVDTFAGYDWTKIGGDILGGMANGIADGVANLVETAIKACTDLAQGVKDFFGIKSPSKMFQGFGAYLSEGMAIGIEDKSGMVTDAIDSLVPPSISPRVSAEMLSSSEIGGTVKKTIEHTGTIRIEGVNNEGQLISAVDILVSQLRRESMLAGTI